MYKKPVSSVKEQWRTCISDLEEMKLQVSFYFATTSSLQLLEKE